MKNVKNVNVSKNSKLEVYDNENVQELIIVLNGTIIDCISKEYTYESYGVHTLDCLLTMSFNDIMANWKCNVVDFVYHSPKSEVLEYFQYIRAMDLSDYKLIKTIYKADGGEINE